MFKEILSIWKKKDLFSQAFEESVEMLKVDKEMFEEAVKSLRTSDTGEYAEDVFNKDKLINKYQRDVRKKVLTHLVMSGKIEIPSGLVLVSIVIDIERIGDYTKNIMDLALAHKTKLHAGSFEKELKNKESKVTQFFDMTIDAFSKSNRDTARIVMIDYKKISGYCDRTINSLIEDANEFTPSDAVTLALYLRYLKRIAAHLHNICTSVVNPFHRIGYIEKGKNQNEQ